MTSDCDFLEVFSFFFAKHLCSFTAANVQWE